MPHYTMKKKQFSTYTLLQTLDGNEQQYIAKRITSPSLRQLYDKQISFLAKGRSAEHVESVLLKTSNTNALRVAQHQLYNEALRLIVQYHTKQNNTFDSYTELLKTDVLKYKNLLHLYELALKKQLAQAKQDGNLSLAYEIAMRLLHVAGLFVQDDTPKLVEHYSKQLQELSQVHYTIAQLTTTFYNLLKLLSQNRYFLQQDDEHAIEAFEKALPLATPYLKSYHEVAFYYHSNKVLIYALQFDHEALQQQMNKLHIAVKKQGSSLQLTSMYVMVLHIYINSRFSVRDFDSVKTALLEIAALKSKDPVMQATKFGILYCNRTRYEATSLQYESLKKTFQYIRNNYEKHIQYFSVDIKTTLYANSIIAAYILEQYEDCKHFHDLTRKMSRRVMRKDAYSFIRIFLLIVYISSEDFEALEKQYRKIKRELTLERRNFKCDYAILDCVNNIIKGNSVKKSVLALSDKLVPLLTDDYESLPLRYFNFIGWCKSVGKGVSYRRYNLMK
jgi:hypothetical protein